MERYDGLGTWRERDEHGNALREDGALLVPGEAEARRYDTAAELMEILAGNERVAESLTRKVVQFSLGRPLTLEDLPEVEAIHAAAREDGGTWQALMVALATSELMTTGRTVREQ